MSVEDLKTVDFIGALRNAPEVVSLGISDHLSWDVPFEEHLYLLQEKINAYIGFIESGEIYQQFPAASVQSKKIIEIFFKYAPPPESDFFFEKVAEILKSINVELQCTLATVE